MNQIPETFWQYLAIAAVGIVVALVGWYAKNTHSDLKDLRKEHKELNDFVLTNFHPKSDINLLLAEIKGSVDKLHVRLDAYLSKGG